MTFSKFNLENPRYRSWVRGKLKVTTWVQHSINSHPFHSMSIRHPIPEIRLLHNLALKIQGQGQGWDQSWKSQSGCYILSTHIPFVLCQLALLLLRYSIFKIWPWKIQGQGHGWGGHWKSQRGSNIILTHVTLIPCQSAIPFLRYDFFKIWPWKSKVKVMAEGNVESHKVGVTSYQLTSLSFHVNRASHSWVMTFSKFDLENQGSRSWARSQFKVTMWV